MQPVQLHFCDFYRIDTSWEDTPRRKAFQVQPVQQSLFTEHQAYKAFESTQQGIVFDNVELSTWTCLYIDMVA